MWSTHTHTHTRKTLDLATHLTLLTHTDQPQMPSSIHNMLLLFTYTHIHTVCSAWISLSMDLAYLLLQMLNGDSLARMSMHRLRPSGSGVHSRRAEHEVGAEQQPSAIEAKLCVRVRLGCCNHRRLYITGVYTIYAMTRREPAGQGEGVPRHSVQSQMKPRGHGNPQLAVSPSHTFEVRSVASG